MQPPAALLKKGVHALPCVAMPAIGNLRLAFDSQNASPEAAVGGGLALVRTGDRVRIDLKKRTANMLITDNELELRRADY